MSDEATEISTHTIWFRLRKTDMLKDPQTERWNIVCDWDQAVRIANEIRALGATIEQITAHTVMTLEGAAKEFSMLKVVAAVTAPSPFNEDGTLTEEAIARGAKIVPDPSSIRSSS